MIGYVCSAVTDFIVTFAEDADIVNLRSWSLGSFSGMSWDNVATAAAFTLVCAGLVFMMSKPIGAYQLGENYARSMGVNIRLFRLALILGGGVFCMLSDLVARTAFAPLELNISTVTSIFGAPVVIVMMLQREKERRNG